MAIASINPIPVPQTIPESEQKSQDLSQSIKENLSKSVKYQIIDKMLVAKEADDKQNHLSQTHNQVTKQDSLTLSSTAKAITEENFTFTDPSTNKSNSLQVSTQRIETGSARLSFSSESIDQPEVKKSDPLAFDLDGNGIQTTGIKQGIQFDINGDGKTEQTSFISGADAFLAYDKNGNGMIDNGSELFGDQNGANNGFEELKKYDDNNDGLIDKNDAVYSDLSLLSLDKNNQHKISSLSDQNIQSINLNYNNQHQAINYYDSIEQTSSFKRTNGTNGYAADVLLGHK